jgi:hypothetical protein
LIGKFLTKKHIEFAVQLLSSQVESSARNHRSLDLEILRREDALNKIDLTNFYSNYIEKDIFFNYPHLFNATPYAVPKGDGGVRQFHFLEAPLWILYYALGFYFLELTKEIREELKQIQKRAAIYTYYGANICLDEPQKSRIHYQQDYQEFTRKIRQTVRKNIKNHKVAVLHLDIQDFFRSIDHSFLIEVLSQQALSKSELELNYNEKTKLKIREILFLIMERSEGLPISQQNIVSNLLSHLFLFPLDNLIHNFQVEEFPLLTFHRYVDDMFLIIPFSHLENKENIGTKMLDVSTRIGEHLSSQLALTLNPLKTRLDIITSEDEINKLIESSCLVSFHAPLLEDGGESPQEILDQAIKVLERLRKKFKSQGYVNRLAANDDLALKRCFQRAVIDYMRSQDAQQQLEVIFKDWHPVLISKSIKILIFLISRVPDALNNLFEHVREDLRNSQPPSTTIHLAEHLMLIEEYNKQFDCEIESLSQKKHSPYVCLINRLINPVPISKNRYIEIEDSFLKKNRSLMEQVRYTRIAQRRGIYSLAYSHLLNTLQEWCFCNEPTKTSRSKYNRKDVVKWLEKITDHSEIIFVIRMFDRRNHNTISHPADEKVEEAAVTKVEYEQNLSQFNSLLVNVRRRYSKVNRS